MKKIIVAIFALALLTIASTGCGAFENSWQKTTAGMSSSDYVVIHYNGGKVVSYYIVRNKFVNTEDNSDGYYWVDNGLHRVSGDVDAFDVHGLSDAQIIEKYHLNN
jgi:hypothetical protein